MKKFFALLLTICCCFSLFIPQAAALDTANTTTRIDLPDGGYIIEEISSNTPATRATTSTSKTKTHTRYTASGHALYAVSVTGSFKYTGSTSWATGSSASVANNRGRSTEELLKILTAWKEQADKSKSGEITKDTYDEWRYNYRFYNKCWGQAMSLTLFLTK